MDCRDLDDLSHDILWYLQEHVRPRRKVNKAFGYRVYPISPDNLADKLQILRTDIRGLLGDLARLGYLEFGIHDEHKSIGEGSGACTCGGRRDSVARTTTPYQTRSASSGEEGGQGEEVPGPKDPSARNTREELLESLNLRTDYDTREERNRKRREAAEEKLRVIESKDPKLLNSDELAFLFGWRVFERQLWAAQVPGAVNHKALASNIAQWIREGSSPSLIREMIEVFSTDRNMLADGDVAWKVFINRRALLAQYAANRVSSRLSDDDLGWDEPLPDDEDDDLGWGKYMTRTDSEH